MDLPRPIFLKLTQIRMPMMALVSILHRISGVVLAIATPFLLYYFSVSLDSVDSYQQLLQQINHISLMLPLVLVMWAFGHHVFAGFRLLLIDFYGRPVQGKTSAQIVLVLSALSFVLAVFIVL
ncbi:MAG: succinate dehydrogenase, cytochrome b556 subunit [Gammaproteobacteria bacterium]|nr:succinate dehydrogenase, cytochrome b556 subunit [Gammaproteobacteria bacterium]